jgi:hypothetical protein
VGRSPILLAVKHEGPLFPHASSTVIERPLLAPATVEPDVLEELRASVEERGQVTVHCTLHADVGDCIRIWPSTFLVCRHSGHRSQLLLADGIPLAPTWMPVAAGRSVCFTLLFAGLPKHCVLFDLVEEIDDPGGFHATSILRNGMDVYRVEL